MWPFGQVHSVALRDGDQRYPGGSHPSSGTLEAMMRVNRLRWGPTWLIRLATIRQRPMDALARLRPLTARRPNDVELRLQLAELELRAGEIDRAIADAGIAIQLAPTDVRGMSPLQQAQARREATAETASGEIRP